MYIERINEMLEIKALQNEYKDLHGEEPYNLSSWLTSKEFEKRMRQAIHLPKISHPIDYVYTYSMDKNILFKLMKKISGKELKDIGISLSSNTTQAIITIVNLLSQFKFKKIGILDPSGTFKVGLRFSKGKTKVMHQF